MKIEDDSDVQAAAKLVSDDMLQEEHDASCTSGYDNDGSTGREIFDNGFELAVLYFKSLKSDPDVKVFSVQGDSSDFFFIGPKETVLKRLAALKDEKPEIIEGGEEEDEDDE